MKKRFISFVLAIVVLIPLLPNSSYGRSLVKEIDVYGNNFKLQVEGKGISHKEVFLYEGDIYVPMTNLANALGMGASFNPTTRTISLNSNGKLSFNDSSKYPISYQRGYEIEAKERIIGNINNQIKEFSKNTSSKPSSNTLEHKTISVGFSGVNILLDGKKISLEGESFIYNNDVYLPLTPLSAYLYITPKLNNTSIDIDANGVLLDKPISGTSLFYSIDELVAFREDVNNRFNRELEELEKKKKILMDVKIPYEKIENLAQMEKYLNKYLGEIKDLDISISLKSATGNWYYVDIDFPTRYNYRWRQLSRRDIESHIWDIYVAISSLYDEEAKLQGNIMKYVSFDTKGKNLVFSFLNSGLDMTSKVDPVFLQELLEKYYGRYRNIYFDYDVRISGYDLEMEINPSTSYFMDRWSPSEKLDFLERINNEIKRYYPGVKVNGKIVYDGYEDISFLIEDNKVRSNILLGDSTDYLEDRFGILSSEGLRIPIKYSLTQMDGDTFKLMAYLDFDSTDPRWNTTMRDDLANLMHEVVKYVVSMWDTNVFVEVFDKNQISIFEYVISQDTVQMVMASPGGGQVSEGSSVSLSTATEGAKIHYTTDGSMPNTTSPVYTSPIVISKNTTIRAYAVKEGFKDSPVSSFEYTVVADKDMASGLDSLVINPGRLSPSFNKNESNYVLEVAYGIDKVDITPTVASGSITINGEGVNSGSSRSVGIKDGDTINVVHKEEGKAKVREYSIKVHVGEEVSSNVKLDPNYSFNTFDGMQSFSGRLTGASFGDYFGYSISIWSGTNIEYKKVNVNLDGSFEITDFPVKLNDRVLEYAYKVYDPYDNKIEHKELRRQ